MKDTFYNQNFECPECKTHQKHYVWSSKVLTSVLPCENKECSYLGEMEPIGQFKVQEEAPGYNHLTRQEVQKERKQRSRDHFKREVLETVPRDFAGKKLMKKYGYKS